MFKRIFYAIFGQPCSFLEQCKKEESESYRLEKNKNKTIAPKQVWRFPMDEGDKYSGHSFIYVEKVEGDNVFYKRNKMSKETTQTSCEQLKKDFLFCPN